MAIFAKVPRSEAPGPSAAPTPNGARGAETPDEAKARREDETLSFVDRWRGQFRLAEKRGDPRYEYLVDKYGPR